MNNRLALFAILVLVASLLIVPTASYSEKSERTCNSEKICAFDGDILRYRLTDTYENSSKNVIVNFKEKIDDSTIRVFIDGLEDEPLTFNLDLETRSNTPDEDDTISKPFIFVKSLPLEIGQPVDQWMAATFNFELTSEEPGTFNSMPRTFMVSTFETPVLTIEYKYDKETGVLVYQAETYGFVDELYKVELVLIETNMLSENMIMESEQSTETKLVDEESKMEKPGMITTKKQLEKHFSGVLTDLSAKGAQDTYLDLDSDTGIIKWMNPSKSIGKISSKDGMLHSFKISLGLDGKNYKPKVGDKVTFTPGKMATNVQPAN